MGQYYKLIVKDDKGIRYNDRKVAGCGYIMAKLMEHSWMGNALCDSVSNHIYNHEENIGFEHVGTLGVEAHRYR